MASCKLTPEQIAEYCKNCRYRYKTRKRYQCIGGNAKIQYPKEELRKKGKCTCYRIVDIVYDTEIKQNITEIGENNNLVYDYNSVCKTRLMYGMSCRRCRYFDNCKKKEAVEKKKLLGIL